MKATKQTKTTGGEVSIAAPRFRTAEFHIKGTAPFVQLRFSEKAKNTIMEKHRKGSQGKKGTKKEARDFDQDYEQAMYVSSEGWHGIPAAAFRNAMVSACRTVGFKMTLAKLSAFVEADGFDKDDGTPLVKIEGKPKKVIHPVRNATGVADLRVRAMWEKWSAKVRIRFDEDLLSLEDVTNLLMRVGMQVGVGEGRPDGKSSCGMGWGLFTL